MQGGELCPDLGRFHVKYMPRWSIGLEYLPTFPINIGQMKVHILYSEHLGCGLREIVHKWLEFGLVNDCNLSKDDMFVLLKENQFYFERQPIFHPTEI